MDINLNSDIGESFGDFYKGNDKLIIPHINSANIACGFHAGDPKIIYNTIKEATNNNVSIGAHPSFPDLRGFGRRQMKLSADELFTDIIYQLGAIDALAIAQGQKLTHVKPHGALNNLAAKEFDTALIIAKAVKAFNKNLIFLAPALSELVNAGLKEDLTIAYEIFADRTYEDDANLTPRSIEGSVLHDGDKCAQRIMEMLDNGAIISRSGKMLKTKISSICVHGDTENSVQIAKTIKINLTKAGYNLKTLPEMNL